jgi:Flp pilus assembly protein TadG
MANRRRRLPSGSGASRRRSVRRGAAIVELAVILPVLLTIALLCVDFGRFAYCYIAVTNAARAGAAYGSSHALVGTSDPVWAAAVQAAVTDDFSQNKWYQASKLTVDQPVVTRDATTGNWWVQVNVQYSFQTLIHWPFLPGYSSPVALHRRVVMRGII